MVMLRSARPLTGVVTLAWLLPEIGSDVLRLNTSTVLVKGSVAVVETSPMTVMVALPPAGTAPSVQTPAGVQLPWLALKLTPLSSAGSVSVTTTFWESEGPALVITIS